MTRRISLMAFFSLALSALLALPGAAFAQGAKTLDGKDKSFVLEAAQGGMAEVETASMAKKKATSAQVREFAERMEQDHGRANDELKRLAQAKGLSLPSEPSKKDRDSMRRLEQTAADKFDHDYMKHMVEDHKKDVSAFERQAKDGKDAEVRAFAERTLPTLRSHLSAATQTYQAVQDATKSASAGKK